MLDARTLAQLPEFKARKAAQWDRIAGTIPGLQLVISGERGSQVMLVCSTDRFYEGVLVGQLPHVVMENFGSPAKPRRRAMANDRKPLERRAIDLTDAEIDQILSLWKRGGSAVVLPFVAAIFDRNGLPRTE